MTIYFSPTGHIITSRGTISLSGAAAAAVSFPIVVDDFEDGDIDEYTGEQQDLDAATVQQTTVFHNDFALELASGSDGSIRNIESQSGLNDYPEVGDTFRFAFQLDNDDTNAQVGFAVQDTATRDLYVINIQASFSDSYSLQRLVDGNLTTLDSGSWPGTVGSWFEIETDWGDPTISMDMFDDQGNSVGDPVQADDTTYTDGGIEWIVQGSLATVLGYFDWMRIVG